MHIHAGQGGNFIKSLLKINHYDEKIESMDAYKGFVPHPCSRNQLLRNRLF